MVEANACFSAALEAIQISGCDSLRCISLEFFLKLKHLAIFHCPNFEWLYASQGDFLQLTTNSFSSKLELLQLDYSNKIYSHLQWILQIYPLFYTSLSFGPQCRIFPWVCIVPSSLTSLEIHDFQNLKSLDRGGLQHLKSLKQLKIWGFPKLSSIPDEGLPPSISVLCILECSLLGERCQQGTGEDWPEISHIPYIEINWEKINWARILDLFLKFPENWNLRKTWLHSIPCLRGTAFLYVWECPFLVLRH